MKVLITIVFIVALFATFASNNLFAQKKGDIKAKELSEVDLREIYKIVSATDEKIKKELMEDKKNYHSMTSEIERIANIKEEIEKIKAIKDYQKKYSKIYSRALINAKVDLNQIVEILRSKFPGYEISNQNNVIQFKSSTSNYSGAEGFSFDETININDFEESKEISCNLISGGEAKHTSNSMEVTSFSAVAGGCMNNGKKTFQYIVPSKVKSAVLSAKANFHIIGCAVGVLGVGMVSNYVRIWDEGNSLEATTIAPFLYVGFQDLKKDVNFTIEREPKDIIKNSVYASSLSISMVCCGTNGKATANNIDVKIELKK